MGPKIEASNGKCQNVRSDLVTTSTTGFVQKIVTTIPEKMREKHLVKRFKHKLQIAISAGCFPSFQTNPSGQPP